MHRWPFTHRLKFSFLLFLVGLFVGLFFAAQLQATPSRLPTLAAPFEAKAQAEASLNETHTNLLNDQLTLRDQLKTLQAEVSHLEQADEANAKVSSKLAYTLDNAKTTVGLTELNGQGVFVVLNDAHTHSSAEGVISAADLRDVTTTLFAAGAKAVAIGDERLVETSSIDAVADTILVNNTRLNAPFTISALGDPLVLKGALIDPNQLTELHHRQQNAGIQFDVHDDNAVVIPAFTGNLFPQYLKSEPQ